MKQLQKSKWKEAPRVGLIPADWDYKPLGKICRASQYGINSSSNRGKRYPILKMNNLQNGKVQTEDLDYINLEIEDCEKYSLKRNDLLVNRTNSYELVGKTALFDLPGEYVFASYLVRFRLNENKAYPNYVNYYFNSHRGKYLLQVLATKGVSQANINPTILKKQFLIPLPPLAEQRKIAEILGTWDEAIALAERRIEAPRQRKKGLMQRLLTGRVRVPEFEGEAWQTVKLGEIFDERKERGYEELPLLSVTAEEGIIYRDELDRRDTSSSDKSNYLRVREGDVTYNTMRMWQGRSGVSEYEGIVSPAYTVCEPKPSIDVVFAGYLFQLPSVIYKFRRYSQGMVSDTWTLRFDNFAAIKVQIPSLEEQKKIAAVLQTCDREIDLLEQKRDALQRQKKGLMQRLLTGRVRVSLPPSNSPQRGEDKARRVGN